MKTESQTNATRTDEQIIARRDPSVRRRTKIQLEIIHRVIQALHGAGFELRVDSGEGVTNSADEQTLVSAIFSVDEATLLTRATGCNDSFVFFVLCNDGHEVISDYGLSLERVIGPVNDWVDAQLDAGNF